VFAVNVFDLFGATFLVCNWGHGPYYSVVGLNLKKGIGIILQKMRIKKWGSICSRG
jgi:hypothetical protein